MKTVYVLNDGRATVVYAQEQDIADRIARDLARLRVGQENARTYTVTKTYLEEVEVTAEQPPTFEYVPTTMDGTESDAVDVRPATYREWEAINRGERADA